MADDVELLVNGLKYRGWTSISVTRAMDAASAAFNLSITERWDGQDQPWPITEGDECQVLIGGQVLITGYVDVFSPGFGASDHTITVQGRDKTADMIDCSAVHSPDEWQNINVLQLARTLAKPFGIEVSADVTVGNTFPIIKLQQGETAFDAVDRHCRMRGLLASPTGNGGLLITRAGTRRAAVALIQGGPQGNILSASGTRDASQRYSKYIVKAQTPWASTSTGEQEAHIQGEATDPTVKRYRPLLVLAETGGSTGGAAERANWEAKVRVGRSLTATVTVQGWRQRPGGALWEPNLLVPVRSPWLKMDGTMLIRSVTYSRTAQGGTTCTLSLVSPLTYSPEPVSDAANGGNWIEAIRAGGGGA